MDGLIDNASIRHSFYILCIGIIGSILICYANVCGGGVLFFCLDTKEKIPKEKIKAAFFLLLTSSVPLKGLELATLRQSPLFTLHCGRSLDGEKMRPYWLSQSSRVFLERLHLPPLCIQLFL